MEKKLKVYDVKLHPAAGSWAGHIIAASTSKARYKAYQEMEAEWVSFKEMLPYLSVKSLGYAQTSDYFGRSDIFDRVKERRGLPLVEQGMRVNVDGKDGIVIGANCDSNFNMLRDGGTYNFHPTWETTYFDAEGMVVYDFKKQDSLTPPKEEKHH